MTSIIKSTSLSHTSIYNDLKNDVLNQTDPEKWKDWLESSTGTIILRWLTALGTYKAYHSTVNRIESSLQHARHENSVTELAFNRGFCQSPTQNCELTIKFHASVERCIITKGQHIGYIGEYKLYSLGDYDLRPETETEFEDVKATAGLLETFTFDYPNLEPFTEMYAQTKHRYVGLDLESLTADSEILTLESDIDYLDIIQNGFVLRRTTPVGVYMYIGNGTLGWYNSTKKSFEYTCLTYDKDLEYSLKSKVISSISATDVSVDIDIMPAFGLTIEEVRRTSMYYPVDGRIVQNADYENVIMKYFGGMLRDTYSMNSDPNEEVYLLPDEAYNDEVQVDLVTLVDNKRELGMQVYYHVTPLEDISIDIVRATRITSFIDYDTLPNYFNRAVDNVTQDGIVLTGYTIDRIGLNNRDYINTIEWEEASAPVDGSTYEVNYVELGKSWDLVLRVHTDYMTPTLSNDINTFLESKTFLFQKEDKTVTSVELAIDLTAEFDISIYPTDESSVILTATDYFKLINVSLITYS